MNGPGWPPRIGNNGVVVIDQLAADSKTDPLFLGIAEFRVREFEIPPNFIRRFVRDFCKNGHASWTCVTTLKAVQHVPIIVVKLESAISIALEAETLLHAERDPMR
jgi:hypothetical protein